VNNIIKNELINSLEAINRSNGVIEFDLNGYITKVNDLFLSVVGFLPNERIKIIGKHHSIFVDPEHAKSLEYKKFWESLRSGDYIGGEFPRINREGSLIYLQATYNPVFDESGNPYKIIKYALDVTYIKKQEQELKNRLNAINSSNAVIEFDLNGIILDANEKFQSVMGFPLENIVGKHHRVFVTEKYENSNEYIDFWNSLKNGEFITGQFERIKSDGTVVWLQATYSPIFNLEGKPYKVMKIATDVTKVVEQKKELEKKNTYLEHASKILRHDMHSGINTYIPRGISSLERRLTEDNIKDLKIEAPLKMIKEGLLHTQKVYRGVFEFTNLVRPNATLNKTECDLSEILDSYLRSTAYRSQVIIEKLGKAMVNEALFCTAIDNLIRNGLKYNDSSTKFVKIYKKSDTLYVEDNGRGLSSTEFKELSEPYTRKEDQTEDGTGLGLNICIAILEEHGYSIECDKLPEIGTQMKIHFIHFLSENKK
jgi:PAS domain S-box-containing protein